MAKVTVTCSVAISLGGLLSLLMLIFQLWSKVMITSILTKIGVWFGSVSLVECPPCERLVLS